MSPRDEQEKTKEKKEMKTEKHDRSDTDGRGERPRDFTEGRMGTSVFHLLGSREMDRVWSAFGRIHKMIWT